MPRRKPPNQISVFGKLKERILFESTDHESYIPNIMEFCEHKKYLNLGADNIKLYPLQRIILKCFYRGQIGNEHLGLTEDEIEYLHDNKMENVVEKYHSGNLFRELVLVLGRRCISEDTLIFDAKTGENKSVAEWHKENGSLNVWTYNQETEQFEINIAETISQGRRECFRVTLDNGDYVDCTDNHPLLTQQGWKKLNELKVSDHIAQADCIPKPPLKFVQIRSIDKKSYTKMYDLQISVKNCHNFVISNGIQVHNSGKDFMTALMALYETLWLLEVPGGSPFKYYQMAAGNPIHILTIATSSDQAKILFNEMKTRIQLSEYFKNKIGKVESDRIWLLTPEDKANNKKLIENGLDTATSPGSVVVLSGHSNSEGLRGKRIFALLLDEVASFKSTGAVQSGDLIYQALIPATADFKAPGGKIKPNSVDKNNPEGLPLLDSKIISISSPRSEEGILYKMYKGAKEVPERLTFRAPTWKVNLKFTESMLRHEFKLMSPVMFAMEFGAEFSGTAGELFIPAKYVDEALEMGRNMALQQQVAGKPGLAYYAHLDPASTSHNYALIVLHVEDRIRVKDNENGIRTQDRIKMFVVDHIMVWQPTVTESIAVAKVDNYIIHLAKRFRFVMVSYDSWNSLSSIQKLRSKGIPSKMTQFRKQYKMHIYDHLEHLLVNHQLALPSTGPWATTLEQELKHLKRIYGPQGFKIKPDEEAPITTDDLCDSLAGACGTALEVTFTGYPKGGTVYCPQSRTLDNHQWKVGGGVYTGDQWKFMHRKFGYNPGMS